MLATMYSLLLLSYTQSYAMGDLMNRCVLMNPKLSRIWSVANVEIGVGYFGVFGAMTFYFIKIRRHQSQHLHDLQLAFAYLVGSFILDYLCVRNLSPFVALLVGDAIVMTFTLFVSRQLWFQRLLGVFVPMIFFTCGMGHFLEGISYWKLTYPLNVPWAMVTADIGFAVLVNAARFPAFIKGSDIQDEMDKMQVAALAHQQLFRDVLFSVTDGKLRFHADSSGLPEMLPERAKMIDLNIHNLSGARAMVRKVADDCDFPDDRIDLLMTASGEALMNAIVHGKNGSVTVRADSGSVQVWITDEGAGIPLQDLPSATLQKGWSSAGTMGIGFPLMLSTSDTVDIATSDKGTTVVVTVGANHADSIRLPFLNAKPTQSQ